MLSRLGPTKTFQLFRKNSPSNFEAHSLLRLTMSFKKESLGKENRKRKIKRMTE